MLGTFFAAAWDVAVVGPWIWKDALPSGWADFFAMLAGVSWLASFGYTIWWVPFCHPDRHFVQIDRLFHEAHEAYLHGRWSESRERILSADGSDGNALMQVGAVYVRTNQPTPARRCYRQSLESERGARWRWEIPRWLAAGS